jgi:protein-S-isoprenylcysteine O-methyltransferase Ste14
MSELREAAEGTDGGVGFPIRPPVLYFLSIAAGMALGARWPVGFLPVPLPWLGTAVVVAAVALLVASIREFRRADTSFRSRRAVRAIVRSGPYRFTRNPIYLAFTLIQLGFAIALDDVWLVVLLVPTVALVHWGVILREERYLTEKFGEAYAEYVRAVRRWV